MFQKWNAGQYHNIVLGTESIESLEHYNYLATTLTFRISIHEETKSIFHSANPC